MAPEVEEATGGPTVNYEFFPGAPFVVKVEPIGDSFPKDVSVELQGRRGSTVYLDGSYSDGEDWVPYDTFTAEKRQSPQSHPRDTHFRVAANREDVVRAFWTQQLLTR